MLTILLTTILTYRVLGVTIDCRAAFYGYYPLYALDICLQGYTTDLGNISAQVTCDDSQQAIVEVC